VTAESLVTSHGASVSDVGFSPDKALGKLRLKTQLMGPELTYLAPDIIHRSVEQEVSLLPISF
jgi:hypothetical protein